MVGSHGGASGAEQRLGAEPAAVEQLDQSGVVGAVVGEDEGLERGVAGVPVGRSVTEELFQVVEIPAVELVADLVGALHMTRESKRPADLVGGVVVVDRERAQDADQLLLRTVGPACRAVPAARCGGARAR